MDIAEDKRKPYVIWNVDGYDYKLKLTTSSILAIEEKLNMNMLDIIMKTTEGKTPPLKIMLFITHQAMLKYEHGIKEKDVIDLFDKYLDEGGDQTTFMTDVFIPIYQVSGFFPQAQVTEMEEYVLETKSK